MMLDARDSDLPTRERACRTSTEPLTVFCWRMLPAEEPSFSYLRREALRRLESRLDSNLFVRIHGSTVVNIDRIREARALFHGDYDALLRDGTRLTVSRRYHSKLNLSPALFNRSAVFFRDHAHSGS